MTMNLPRPVQKYQSGYILSSALALGLAGDYLFWPQGPWNLSGSIWVALLGLATILLNRNADPAWRKVLLIWTFIAFSTTTLLVIRDIQGLIPLTLLVQIFCATAVLMQASGTRLLSAKVEDFLFTLKTLPEQALTGFWSHLEKLPSIISKGHSRSNGIARGVLIVAPLMLIFTGLFSAADANFERYALGLGDILYIQFPKHLITIAIISGLATGLLICTMPDKVRPVTSQSKSQLCRQSLGDEETTIIMGALVSLFLVFVVLQASYLFGGRETIEQVSGLTLAAYARRGFFELLAVSILTLTILLGISALQCNQRIFQPLATVLVCCVLIILASAAQRLYLYTATLGLTLSRIMASVCMLWLALNLIVFAATVLRGRSAGFASSMILSGIASIIVVGAINPAAIVARVNIDTAVNDNLPIDAAYLMTLGADAVPPILTRIHLLPDQEKCLIAYELITQYAETDTNQQGDWRSWNASRRSAQRGVIARYDELAMLTKNRVKLSKSENSPNFKQNPLNVCR